MTCYGGLKGILSGLTKSTDHPSRKHSTLVALSTCNKIPYKNT